MTERILKSQPYIPSLYLRSVLPKRQAQALVLPNGTLSVHNLKLSSWKIKAYSKVCGFNFDGTLPASYPHVLAFPLMLELMLDKQFPFPVMGMVHISNSISQHRKINCDEKLDIQCRFGELKEHSKGKLVELLCNVSIEGECVWQSKSDMLIRQSGTHSIQKIQHRTALSQQLDSWSLGTGLGRKYALVSGDSNPIHLSSLSAKAFGFKRCIMHGMWTKARCLAQLQKQLPDAFSVDVEFKLPVFLPSTLSYFQEPVANGWVFDVCSEEGEKLHLIGSITTVQNKKSRTK